MENKFRIANNGQELQQDDVNQVAEQAALADDRVFAEFLRMKPYDGSTVVKGILPYTTDATNGETDPFNFIDVSGIADRYVFIRPFRAFVGTRTAAATDAKKNVQDIRSVLVVGPGPDSHTATPPGTWFRLGDYSAGATYRWDLIYLAVSVDADAATVSRYIKDPSTLAIAASNVVTNIVTSASIAVVNGTPHATTPTQPAVPADGGGVYNIPLAYVRRQVSVPTVELADIQICAPMIPMARSNGVSTLRPASGQFKSGVGAMTTTALNSWASSGVRPSVYIPPNCLGSEKLIVALDFSDASSANWSHAQYAVIDDSRDWRKHLFHSWAQACNTAVAGTQAFSWVGAGAPNLPSATDTLPISMSCGQSFQTDLTVGSSGGSGFGTFSGPNNGRIAARYYLATSNGSTTVGDPWRLDSNAAFAFAIYVDGSTGELKLFYGTGISRSIVFVHLEAIGPMPSY